MSTSMRRSREKALAEADNFKNLLKPEITCERFEFAGSLRRGKADVGDIDICCIPRFADLPKMGDLFGETERANLLWQRVNDMVGIGTFTKHIKETAAGPRPKWGDGCRAIEFRGCAYEIQMCDPDNWALWLAVRTGPAELSKEIVTRLPKYGYTSRDGFYIHLTPK